MPSGRLRACLGSICRDLAREHDVPISPPRQLLLPRPVAPDVAARASRWRLGPRAHPATRASLDRVDNYPSPHLRPPPGTVEHSAGLAFERVLIAPQLWGIS